MVINGATHYFKDGHTCSHEQYLRNAQLIQKGKSHFQLVKEGLKGTNTYSKYGTVSFEEIKFFLTKTFDFYTAVAFDFIVLFLSLLGGITVSALVTDRYSISLIWCILGTSVFTLANLAVTLPLSVLFLVYRYFLFLIFLPFSLNSIPCMCSVHIFITPY
jgi:hypothetical protein